MSDNRMFEDEVLEDKAAASSTASAMPSTLAHADLHRTATDPALTEGFALALLRRADLPLEVIQQLARNTSALKSRKVKTALATHPTPPRPSSLPLPLPVYP